MSSSDSSDNHSQRKKRRHKSSSPEKRRHRHSHSQSHTDSERNQSTGHRHQHRHRERDGRDRPIIKTELRESPEGSHHRSRSPVDTYHRPIKHEHDNRRPIKHEHDDRRPIKREHDDRRPIKREHGDRKYDRAAQGSRDRNERRHHDRRREQHHRDTGQEQWGKSEDVKSGNDEPKDQPDFGLSGKLTEETNTYKGVVIKYNEPPEARKPRKRWRLYPFKGDEALPVMHIHRQSAFLFGRDRRIADLPVDHPSCSKQHAVLQYRLVDYKRDSGVMGRKIKPYVIDLGSANGTYVNNQRIDSERYVELLEKDVIKFGFSSREYVILHDAVKVDEDELEDE